MLKDFRERVFLGVPDITVSVLAPAVYMTPPFTDISFAVLAARVLAKPGKETSNMAQIMFIIYSKIP